MCCLFGLIDYGNHFSGKQKSKILNNLAVQCQVRGTDATGIAYNTAGSLSTYKRPLPAHRMKFRIPRDATVVMGHTRLTTQGSEKKNYNNHPFRGQVGNTSFALAHNGVLYNDELLREQLNLPATAIETDSYIAVQLLEQYGELSFGSLKEMAEKVMGTFVFTILDKQNNLSIVKGDNPLCLYHYPEIGVYLYASTEEILKKALRRLWFFKEPPINIPIHDGDILTISQRGELTTDAFSLHQSRYSSWGHGWERPYHYDSWMPTVPQYRYDEGGDYLAELKTVAAFYGYTPEDIDQLLDTGFTMDEVSELIYCGEI